MIRIEPDYPPTIFVSNINKSPSHHISYWQISGWILLALFIVIAYVPKSKSNKYPLWIGNLVVFLLMCVSFGIAQNNRHNRMSMQSPDVLRFMQARAEQRR